MRKRKLEKVIKKSLTKRFLRWNICNAQLAPHWKLTCCNTLKNLIINLLIPEWYIYRINLPFPLRRQSSHECHWDGSPLRQWKHWILPDSFVSKHIYPKNYNKTLLLHFYQHHLLADYVSFLVWIWVCAIVSHVQMLIALIRIANSKYILREYTIIYGQASWLDYYKWLQWTNKKCCTFQQSRLGKLYMLMH